MSRTCTLCGSLHRPQIDAALLRFESERTIANRHGITKAALHRHKSHLKHALVEAEKRRGDTLLVTVQRLVKEYARIAFLDPADFFDADGKLRPIHDIPEDARRAISSIEHLVTDRGESTRLRFAGKQQALDSLAKHLGMFAPESQGANVTFNLTPEQSERFVQAAEIRRELQAKGLLAPLRPEPKPAAAVEVEAVMVAPKVESADPQTEPKVRRLSPNSGRCNHPDGQFCSICIGWSR